MFKVNSGPSGSEYNEVNPGALASRYLHSSSGAVSDDGLSKILSAAIKEVHKQYLKAKPPDVAAKEDPTVVRIWDPCGNKGSPTPPPNLKGRLFSIAAMVLMHFMYQSRTARFDV